MRSLRRSAFHLSINCFEDFSILFCAVYINNATCASIHPGFSFDSLRYFLSLRRLDGAVPIIKAEVEAP